MQLTNKNTKNSKTNKNLTFNCDTRNLTQGLLLHERLNRVTSSVPRKT